MNAISALGAPAIARTVASITPLVMPRQPACTVAMRRAAGSTRRTGTQSAIRTARTTPGSSVHSASIPGSVVSGESAPAPFRSPSTRAVSAPWTCRPLVHDAGSPPITPIARARFAITTSASSPEKKDRFSDENGSPLNPPCRVVKAMRMPALSSAGTARYAPGEASPRAGKARQANTSFLPPEERRDVFELLVGVEHDGPARRFRPEIQLFLLFERERTRNVPARPPLEPGRDHRHPDFVAERIVDRRSEDHVRFRVRVVADD